jgi:hypothetical protein
MSHVSTVARKVTMLRTVQSMPTLLRIYLILHGNFLDLQGVHLDTVTTIHPLAHDSGGVLE